MEETPAYVSPATQSLAVTIGGATTNIDVANGSPGCATSYTAPVISEIPVGSEPRGMVTGSDGNPWFVEDNGGGLGTIKPGNVFSNFSTGYLPGKSSIMAPDGHLDRRRLLPDQIKDIATDPHPRQIFPILSDVFQMAVAAKDNTVWFSDKASGNTNTLFHIGGNGTYPYQELSTIEKPGWIVQGPDGAMYADEGYSGSDGYFTRFVETNGVWATTFENHLSSGPSAMTVGPACGI